MRNVYRDPSYATIVRDLKIELKRLKAELGDEDEQYPELVEVNRAYWDHP